MNARTFRYTLLVCFLPIAGTLAQPSPASAGNSDKSKGGTSAAIATVKYALILPNDKTSESVKPEDRNPFGRAQEDSKQFKGTSEEVMIRDRLMKLRVCGASMDEKGDVTRVMLGDMILTPGQGLPAVLQSQTLALRVGAMTKSAIELVWIEKKPLGLPERKLILPVDLRPFVRYRLLGQEPGSRIGKNGKGGNAGSMGLQFSAELSNVPLDALPASLKNHLPGLPALPGEEADPPRAESAAKDGATPPPVEAAKPEPIKADALKPDSLKQAFNVSRRRVWTPRSVWRLTGPSLRSHST